MILARYATDLTDIEWAVLAPLIPAAKAGGRPRTTDMRQVVNAIFYVLRGGCQWRLLPKDFPPHQTVYDYFRSWRLLGGVGTDTRQTARGCAGSQWSQSGAERWNYRQSDSKDDRKREIRGYDGGKRTLGRKRHLVVDVLGLLLIVMVHSAGIQHRNGAKQVLTRLISCFPGLKLVWADGGYAGKLVEWVATVLQRTISIVNRPRKTQGFQVLQ